MKYILIGLLVSTSALATPLSCPEGSKLKLKCVAVDRHQEDEAARNYMDAAVICSRAGVLSMTLREPGTQSLMDPVAVESYLHAGVTAYRGQAGNAFLVLKRIFTLRKVNATFHMSSSDLQVVRSLSCK